MFFQKSVVSDCRHGNLFLDTSVLPLAHCITETNTRWIPSGAPCKAVVGATSYTACTPSTAHLRTRSPPATKNNYSIAGAAADTRGKDMVAPGLYVDKATEPGMTVSAFNVETYGGWGEQARTTLKHITKTAISVGTRGHGGWAARSSGANLSGLASPAASTSNSTSGSASVA